MNIGKVEEKKKAMHLCDVDLKTSQRVCQELSTEIQSLDEKMKRSNTKLDEIQAKLDKIDKEKQVTEYESLKQDLETEVAKLNQCEEIFEDKSQLAVREAILVRKLSKEVEDISKMIDKQKKEIERCNKEMVK